MTPEENCPPVGVRVRVRVSFRVEEQFPSGAMVLEPVFYTLLFFDCSTLSLFFINDFFEKIKMKACFYTIEIL